MSFVTAVSHRKFDSPTEIVSALQVFQACFGIGKIQIRCFKFRHLSPLLGSLIFRAVVQLQLPWPQKYIVAESWNVQISSVLVASTDLLLLRSSAAGKRGKFEDSDWLLEERAGGVFRTITVSISFTFTFTLWSFYVKICTSGSLKLPCIDVSMQISHFQTTSAIFTAVKVRLERINLPCSQASQGQDAPSFLSLVKDENR